MKKTSAVALLAALIILWAPLQTDAADFPAKPVNMILGLAPGGMTDVVSRILAPKMEEFLKQKIIVENKPGAGGYTALKSVLDGPADGYTVVSCSTSTAISGILLGRPYALDKLALVGSFMSQERVMFARKDGPFKTFEEMVKYAKNNPVTFAGGGSLWTDHVVEALAKELEIKLNIVPFRSGAEGSAAILGGHVMLAETGVGTPAWQAGKKGDLVIIAVLSDADLKKLGYPEVKNLQQLGVKHFSRQVYGYALPKGVPEERRGKLEAALRFAVEHPEVEKRMTELDLPPAFLSGKEYGNVIQSVISEATALRNYLKK